MLVKWPDGWREALLFVLEEETEPRRFSIHRLAHYCLDLADLIGRSSNDQETIPLSWIHSNTFHQRGRMISDSFKPNGAFAPSGSVSTLGGRCDEPALAKRAGRRISRPAWSVMGAKGNLK